MCKQFQNGALYSLAYDLGVIIVTSWEIRMVMFTVLTVEPFLSNMSKAND